MSATRDIEGLQKERSALILEACSGHHKDAVPGVILFAAEMVGPTQPGANRQDILGGDAVMRDETVPHVAGSWKELIDRAIPVRFSGLVDRLVAVRHGSCVCCSRVPRGLAE